MTLYKLDGVAPQLPDEGDCWIAPNATVIGRVSIGVGVTIWFGSTLRGDNEPMVVSDGCNIQEHCVFHSDPGYPLTLHPGVTVGHRAILHGCVVGKNSLIGMGAIVLNGATIGENCLIGAGALIAEGKVIPDNSLVVGAPGRIIRTLDAESALALEKTAAHYVANGKRFSQGLETID